MRVCVRTDRQTDRQRQNETERVNHVDAIAVRCLSALARRKTSITSDIAMVR